MCNKTIIIGVKYLQRPEYSGCEAEAEASYVAGFPVRMWLRLVTSRGSPYPSRSPRAHPSGWTRTQDVS
jgi:hypothetical protein